MLMMYGYAPKTLDYPVIHAADESARLAASLLGPGGTLLNVLPVLRHIPSWVPGASGKKMAEKVRLLTEEVKRIPMEHVKAALVCKIYLNFRFSVVILLFIAGGHGITFICDRFSREESYCRPPTRRRNRHPQYCMDRLWR
jgi:hypothetical protein